MSYSYCNILQLLSCLQLISCRTVTVMSYSYCHGVQILSCRTVAVMSYSCCRVVQLLPCHTLVSCRIQEDEKAVLEIIKWRYLLLFINIILLYADKSEALKLL